MDLTIFKYRVRDNLSGNSAIELRMATREYIERAGWEILENTAKTVDESRVNEEGQEILDPAKGQ